ncbi:MAG: site-specific integrase [Draconibacterium sp.]
MNSFSTLSVNFLIRKNRANSDKEVPIYVRITVENERAEIATGRFIDPDDWDGKSNKAIGKKKGNVQLNKFLDIIKSNIYEHHTEMVKNGEHISARNIKSRFLGLTEKQKTLIQIFEYHNQQIKELSGTSYADATIKRYTTTIQHVKSFLKYQYQVDDIALQNIKYSFISDFEHYFKIVRKCNHNTTVKYLKNLRKIINLAVKNEWLEKDPFQKFKSKIIEVKRDFITKEELQRLEDLKLSFTRLEIVKDVFIFACYSGLAFVDVANLTRNNIRLGIDGDLWILTERTKTKNQSNIPLLPKAHDLIEKYSSYSNKKTDNHIFPVFSNQKMNAYLKEIADLASIDKNLTFHIARHTFATTITLANGVPIESISSMLGHKSIRTTQIYSKVINEKVSNDMNLLKKKLG